MIKCWFNSYFKEISVKRIKYKDATINKYNAFKTAEAWEWGEARSPRWCNIQCCAGAAAAGGAGGAGCGPRAHTLKTIRYVPTHTNKPKHYFLNHSRPFNTCARLVRCVFICIHLISRFCLCAYRSASGLWMWFVTLDLMHIFRSECWLLFVSIAEFSALYFDWIIRCVRRCAGVRIISLLKCYFICFWSSIHCIEFRENVLLMYARQVFLLQGKWLLIESYITC